MAWMKQDWLGYPWWWAPGDGGAPSNPGRFVNDYGDFTKGTDTAAGCTDRVLASGQLTISAMKKGVILTAIKPWWSVW